MNVYGGSERVKPFGAIEKWRCGSRFRLLPPILLLLACGCSLREDFEGDSPLSRWRIFGLVDIVETGEGRALKLFHGAEFLSRAVAQRRLNVFPGETLVASAKVKGRGQSPCRATLIWWEAGHEGSRRQVVFECLPGISDWQTVEGRIKIPKHVYLAHLALEAGEEAAGPVWIDHLEISNAYAGRAAYLGLTTWGLLCALFEFIAWVHWSQRFRQSLKSAFFPFPFALFLVPTAPIAHLGYALGWLLVFMALGWKRIVRPAAQPPLFYGRWASATAQSDEAKPISSGDWL